MFIKSEQKGSAKKLENVHCQTISRAILFVFIFLFCNVIHQLHAQNAVQGGLWTGAMGVRQTVEQ